MQGGGIGARVRRWWWGVNAWALPEGVDGENVGGRAGGRGGRMRDERLARDVGDVSITCYYCCCCCCCCAVLKGRMERLTVWVVVLYGAAWDCTWRLKGL